MKQPDKCVLLECNGVPRHITYNHIQQLFEPEIFRLTKSFVSKADAEEITSETFVKLHNADLDKAEINTLEKVKAFLLVCAKNECLDLIRSQRTKAERWKQCLAQIDLEINQIIPYKDADVEIPPKIQRIIKNLPRSLREVLQSSYRNESDDEIALRLGGIQTNTVKRYRTKALRTIRKELGLHVK